MKRECNAVLVEPELPKMLEESKLGGREG